MEKQLSSDRTFTYKDINKAPNGLLDHIRVLSVFLLILIPIVYLYYYFNELAENTGFIKEELVKEQLISEMNRFQEDLNPKNFIEHAFQDLEKKFKIPDLNDTQYKYVFNEENEPGFLKGNFIGKARYFLKNTYGFEPFIFVSSGYDLTDMDLSDKDQLFKNPKERENFLYSCIFSLLHDGLEPGYTDVRPVSKKNLNYLASVGRKAYYKIEKTFILQVLKKISLFYGDLGKPSHCSAFFTNNFGNQKIYQYYNRLIKKERKYSKFLGLYYVLIKSSDISIEKVLYNAFHASSDNNSLITRSISENRVKSPILNQTDKSIEYRVPFPSHFYNFIYDHKSKNPNIFELYHNYLDSHSLTVSIDIDKIVNDYTSYKNITEKIIYVLIIGFLIFLIIDYFKTKKINLSLSFKVRLVVFVAVSIPLIGLWVITYLGMKNEERTVLAKTEKIIDERMALFDKIKEDCFNELTINMMKDKKKLTDKLLSDKNVLFAYPYSDTAFAKELAEKDYLSYVVLLDKSGKSTGWMDITPNKDGIEFKTLIFPYRYLLDMNLLDQNTKENNKNYGQYILMSTFIDSYIKSNNRKNILAKESLLIPSGSIRYTDKVSYQLVSSPKKPNSPFALIYNSLNMRDLMDYRLNKIIVNHFSELLSQETDYAQIKYAIFSRHESYYREKIPQMRAFPFRQMQLDALHKAIGKMNSGSEIEEKDRYYYIKTWRYYNDNPILFVSGAIVPKKQINFVSSKILILILVIYTLLVVILLSDFFSGALLEPIRTLSKFVNEIKLGHLNVLVNMKTGDEMQELGDSFNKMSDGLCEREKLKRFVSDKLFSSLEKNNEQRITKSNVTILSSDIRSFTTISEQNEPEVVVSLLNDYFTLMEESIVKYGGSIEKIVGDAISAAFYEDKSPEYAMNACKAALEMRESLKRFNEERKTKGLFTIENGIGLATGSVMIGFAGEKSRRREFLLIGNIIKLAENLESKTKQAVSSKVFIDKPTYDLVSDKVKLCPEDYNSDIYYRELLL